VDEIFDNLMWHDLTGSHAGFTVGNGIVRRYTEGFAPFAGFRDPARPDFDALGGLCEPGLPVFLGSASDDDALPEGWSVLFEATAQQMVWEGGLPCDDEALGATRLGAGHVPQVLELAGIAQPGPFGPRTIELGEWFGVFDGGALVAMAGERMHAGHFREVSGIATLPSHRGRGLARRLTERLIRRELLRGETPFLHVMNENENALRLYDAMGFRTYREVSLRVVARS
jgi:ribosomal protein S18 acetylase RimI-like enzyme